jgi:hypothetical protein
MKLVIDRSRWLRGEGPSTSSMIRLRDEKMCCLGFFGLACGIERDRLLNRLVPTILQSPNWPVWLVDLGGNTTEARLLMNTNDSEAMSGAEREAALTAVFASHGVEVEFVDGPVSP